MRPNNGRQTFPPLGPRMVDAFDPPWVTSTQPDKTKMEFWKSKLGDMSRLRLD